MNPSPTWRHPFLFSQGALARALQCDGVVLESLDVNRNGIGAKGASELGEVSSLSLQRKKDIYIIYIYIYIYIYINIDIYI